MKINSKLFYKSFFLSFVVLAIVAAIIVTSLYTDAISVEPKKRESSVLVGVTHNEQIVSLMVLNLDPKNNSICFLPIPDNTLLSDGVVLQSLYQKGRVSTIESHIERMIGAKINRYIVFSTDAIVNITDEIGKFEYLIPYKFVYNGHEHSGQSYMYGELAAAMFSYEDYDMTKVSLTEIGNSFLQSFLSKHSNPSNVSKIAAAVNSNKASGRIDTDLSADEIAEYCDFLAKYSSLTHLSADIEGEAHLTSSRLYFTPATYNSDKNIFK